MFNQSNLLLTKYRIQSRIFNRSTHDSSLHLAITHSLHNSDSEFPDEGDFVKDIDHFVPPEIYNFN